MSRLRAGLAGLALAAAGSACAANIAPAGTAILGYNDAIDGDAGTLFSHYGLETRINDENIYSAEDNWSGGADAGQAVSFVGILWPGLRLEGITTLTLTLATFGDGGWFGVPTYSPAPGSPLTAADYLVEPSVQVTTDHGVTWTPVAYTSDYLTALDGHLIGGGGQPNPTAVTATFTLTPAITSINGIRIIGDNGGYAGADGNGFIGVFELVVEGTPPGDIDSDGLPDVWETTYGLQVGVNDAAGDKDGDGLSNMDEFNAGTRPDQGDTDADGLTDGAEVHTHKTNPTMADTDGDGLSDGAEVNTHKTNPLLTDTDADGLSDGAEVNTHGTKPLIKDTDADGFLDGIEVAQGTDPRNPASYPSNAAIIGSGILGVNNAIDADAGTPRWNAGVLASINDGNLDSRVDNWFGGNSLNVSFVGVLWPTPLATQIKSVTLTLATFADGGWFGPSGVGPGAGGYLDDSLLLEPTIQISTDGGTTWAAVDATSDYLIALYGHSIGGGGNVNPTTVTTEFTLTSPPSGVTGIRVIGENGGNAGSDANGFIGVFEMVVTAGIANDSDNDGMDDTWETTHGLQVGTNDAAGDPDSDGLTNIQEFASNTDPKKADTDNDGLKDGEELGEYNTSPLLPDTDGDGLTDGTEVLTAHSDPLVADTDGDGLSDGDEVNTHHTNPTLPDTDGDAFTDGIEVTLGSDPTSATSKPDNVAVLGTGIIGIKDTVASGAELPWPNAGVVENINDLSLLTRVDTYNGAAPTTASYVGIRWDQPITDPVVRLNLALAVFFDGGWFGPNGIGPGAGGFLSPNYLAEPIVQVWPHSGTDWVTVPHTSDYLTALDGHPLPAVAFGAPTTGQATFSLTAPQSNIDAVRLLGVEGGTASGGFLGVFELAVEVHRVTTGVTLASIAKVNGQLQFEFDSQAGVTHVVEYQSSLGDAQWHKLATIPGDGSRKTVTDSLATARRFYRVTSQ